MQLNAPAPADETVDYSSPNSPTASDHDASDGKPNISDNLLRQSVDSNHLLGSLGPLSTDRGDGERHTGMAFEAGRTHPHLNSEQQEARDFSERNDDDDVRTPGGAPPAD